MWDAESGIELAVLRGHDDKVNSVAFAPNMNRIVSGSNDRTVRLWDSLSGVVLAVFHGHLGTVTSVAFSPDGQQIASASTDGTVRLWDVLGAELVVLPHHDNEHDASLPDSENRCGQPSTDALTLIKQLLRKPPTTDPGRI